MCRCKTQHARNRRPDVVSHTLFEDATKLNGVVTTSSPLLMPNAWINR